MPVSRSRRDLLRTSGATLSAGLLSGCMDVIGSSENSTTATPAPVPSLEPTPTTSPVPANTVLVGPEGTFGFVPEELRIETGTTVTWVWESGVHNIAISSQPEEANWEGHLSMENDGFTYEHTFSVVGRYRYRCEPHEQFEAFGTITVE